MLIATVHCQIYNILNCSHYESVLATHLYIVQQVLHMK